MAFKTPLHERLSIEEYQNKKDDEYFYQKKLQSFNRIIINPSLKNKLKKR